MPHPAAAEALVDRLLGRRPPAAEVAEIVTGVYRRRAVEAQTDVQALEAYVAELLGALETIGAAAGAPWNDAEPTEDNVARVLAAIGAVR